MKRCIALLLAAALAAALLGGCAPQQAETPEKFQLWFTSDLSQWTSDATALQSRDYEGEETVPAVMAALLAGPPADSGLVSPFPAGTTMMSWSLTNGILRVDLSRAYGNLVGVDLTLADYCLTLTLTQLNGVDGVRITVNGTGLAYRDRQVFYAEDVVFSGAEEEPVELSAALYFLRADSGELGYELRIFQLTESESPTLAVLEALAAGPADTGLAPLIPEGVEVYSARVDGGVCYADFSAALLDTVPADGALQVLILSSVVETLCGMEDVETVQILVEGETVSYYGQVDISQPLEPAAGRS